MKECELCDSPARMYCESDEASLCWDCDAKVHCANFLVARHTRSLLCHSCQSPTPWKASGSKLGPTISICERCVNKCNGKDEREINDDEGKDREDDDDDEDEDDQVQGEETDEGDDGGGDDDADEDGENQVVPWSSTHPPPIASSSSSEESSSTRLCNGRGTFRENNSTASLSLKRMREKLDLNSQDDLGCIPSQSNQNSTLAASTVRRTPGVEETSLISSRPLKDRKLALTIQSAQTELESSSSSSSSPTIIISSLQRFEQKIISREDTSKSILAICKLSKDPRAV